MLSQLPRQYILSRSYPGQIPHNNCHPVLWSLSMITRLYDSLELTICPSFNAHNDGGLVCVVLDEEGANVEGMWCLVFQTTFPRRLLRFSRIGSAWGSDIVSRKYCLKCSCATLSHNGASILIVDFPRATLSRVPLESPLSIARYNLDPWFPIEHDLIVWVSWLTPINEDFFPPFFPIFYSLSLLKKIFSYAFSSLSILSSCQISALRGSSIVLMEYCKAVHPSLHLRPMEASRASGGKDGAGRTGGQGCGVRRALHGGGPVGGESPPTLEELGESLPSPGRSQVLKPLTQPLSRSRMWSLMQPHLGLGSSPGLGSRTSSCLAGSGSTWLCTYPLLPIDLGIIIHKRL